MIIRGYSAGPGTILLHITSQRGYYLTSFHEAEPNVVAIGYLRRDMALAERAFDKAADKVDETAAQERKTA